MCWRGFDGIDGACWRSLHYREHCLHVDNTALEGREGQGSEPCDRIV